MAVSALAGNQITVLLSIASILATGQAQLSFSEVTVQVGLQDRDQDKVCGPSVGDLNQDGYLDIVQSNHAKGPVEVYLGKPDGTFDLTTPFPTTGDDHGTAIGDIDNDGYPDIVLTLGGFLRDSVGRFTALPPRIVKFYRGNLVFVPGRHIGWIGNHDFERGTMQAVRLVDMDGDGDLDAFCQIRRMNSVYENLGNGQFRNIQAGGLERGKWLGGSMFFDFNNDGYMDVLLFGQPMQGVQVWQGNPGFMFTEVTLDVFPRKYGRAQYSGAAEFDYDNDGDLDIYLGGGSKRKLGVNFGDDILLENVGGRYIDVSRKAKLPRGGAHQGVTVGDFNNDGWQDVFLPRVGSTDERIGDLILINNGDKTFTEVEDHGANGVLDGSDLSFPSGAQAFDYDKDGRVDVLVASRRNGAMDPSIPRLEGNLRLFKNLMTTDNNFVTLKVPVVFQGSTMMDSIVTLDTAGGSFVRRVGSAGEGRAQSFNDQIHFGLGSTTKLFRVRITLTNGITLRRNLRSTAVNSIISLGRTRGRGSPPPDIPYCTIRDPCAPWRFFYFLSPGDIYYAYCGDTYEIQGDCSQVAR